VTATTEIAIVPADARLGKTANASSAGLNPLRGNPDNAFIKTTHRVDREFFWQLTAAPCYKLSFC
jgi:hypothetical protein